MKKLIIVLFLLLLPGSKLYSQADTKEAIQKVLTDFVVESATQSISTLTARYWILDDQTEWLESYADGTFRHLHTAALQANDKQPNYLASSEIRRLEISEKTSVASAVFDWIQQRKNGLEVTVHCIAILEKQGDLWKIHILSAHYDTNP